MTAIPNNKIGFDILYYHDIRNATLVLDKERTVIRVDYPNEQYNDINVTNHRGEDQIYHLDHMLWKIPAEHTINQERYAAELQVYHVQYASNRKVALSILFDTQEYYDMLEMTNDTSRLKTCFVNAFDFGKVQPAAGNESSREEVAKNLTIPLFEFMRYI